MLVNLKISNFLSYKDETELSLYAGKVRKCSERVYAKRNIRVLKCLSIFGSNASGKSNFVKTLEFIKFAIIENKIPRGFSNKYFRLDKKMANEPSKFEITILIDNKIFIYGFNINLPSGKFIDEWLYEKGNESFKVLYELDCERSEFHVGSYFKSKKAATRLEIYGNDCIGTNSLFLSNINEKKDKMYEDFKELRVLRDIYEWFSLSLKIHFPSNQLDVYPDFIESNITEISRILNSLDTGVSSVKYMQQSVDQIKNKLPMKLVSDIYDELMKQEEGNYDKAMLVRSDKQFYTFELNEEKEIVVSTLQFTHNLDDVYFDMDEESDGTRHLLDLVEILLDTNRNKIFVFDEIERCLHPSVTVKLLELFLELAKTRNNQLIITTHESRILAEDILRNDEIVFIKKDKEGASVVVPLDTLKLRSDKKVYQAFFDLKNGLGVLPNIDAELLLK